MSTDEVYLSGVEPRLTEGHHHCARYCLTGFVDFPEMSTLARAGKTEDSSVYRSPSSAGELFVFDYDNRRTFGEN